MGSKKIWGIYIPIGLSLLVAFGAGWPLSLVGHFRLQWLTILLITIVVDVIVQVAWQGIVCLVAFWVYLALPVFSYWHGQAPPMSTSRSHTFLFANVYRYTPDRGDRLQALIAQEQPEIVALVEFDRKWHEKFSLKQYPYFHDGQGNIGFFSKFPFNNLQLYYPTELPPVANHAALLVDTEIEGIPITIGIAHPPIPLSRYNLRTQRRMIAAWCKLRHQWQKELIWAGDLNTTPWSVEFRKLTQCLRLQDSRRGFGIYPTWPTYLSFLGIPIDHVLVSSGLQVLSHQRGENIGSDHFPLITRFTQKAAS